MNIAKALIVFTLLLFGVMCQFPQADPVAVACFSLALGIGFSK